MKLNEVVDVLRVSASTIKKKAAKGEIPCVKIGRARLFHPEHVYQYIVTHTRQLGAVNG